MKTRLFALAWMPVLGLLTAVTLAGETPVEDYYFSANGTAPLDGILKSQNDCPDGTFFKNAYPSLTNGTPGGSTTIDFNVEGKIVPMTVTWEKDNSFYFEISGGYAQEVGLTVDTNNFTYNYRPLNEAEPVPVPVQGDQRLNKLLDASPNVRAGDVNHLDLCLVALDDEHPDVTITSPADGSFISGIVSIIATITDNIELDLTKVTASVDGVSPDDIDGPSIDGNVFTWTFDASALDTGDYKITVSATDTSILANPTTVFVTVTVPSLLDCLEGSDGVPDGEPSAGGCDLTGFMQLEYPNAAGGAGALTVTQAAIPAKAGAGSTSCRTDLYPLIAQDPRVNEYGELNDGPIDPLNLSNLFDIAGHYTEFHPVEDVPEVWLRADTVGSPCLALLHQDAPAFEELAAYLENGGVYTVTQRPEDVPGMYAVPRITAPLSDSQPDLQFVEQAALQPDERTLLVEEAASPFTSDVFNASRSRGFDGTFFPLNTREVCLSLDPTLSPDNGDGAPYFEAVLQCKTDLAVEYFDNLEQALIEAEPNLISPSLNGLLTDVNKARSMVKVGRWNKATKDLSSLRTEVTDATWNVDYRNDPGNLIMRIDNLFFRIEQLKMAENNLP